MTADEQTERETAAALAFPMTEYTQSATVRAFRNAFGRGWDAARLVSPAPQVTRETWIGVLIATGSASEQASKQADAILALLTGESGRVKNQPETSHVAGTGEDSLHESDAVTVETKLDPEPWVFMFSNNRYNHIDPLLQSDLWRLTPRIELGYSGNPADYQHTNNEEGK